MPYVRNGGISIHYQLEGDGPPLVLQHGFTQTLADWYECGYVDPLKHDHRLILIDARGHGASDKPHDREAYRLDTRVGDVVAVLDALAIEKADFWGYSMGGWIGFGMAEFAPERVERLVIGAAHPYDYDYSGWRQLVQVGIDRGFDAFLAAGEQASGTLPPGYKARLQQADLKALLAGAQDRPSMEALLPRMTMPCCLYAGEADPLFAKTKAASERVARACFFSLPGLAHTGSFFRSDLALPRVIEFLGPADS